jgi:hypothetical protein
MQSANRFSSSSLVLLSDSLERDFLLRCWRGEEPAVASCCCSSAAPWSGTPVELPLLADRPTVSGRGRWDWKLPAEETASLLSLLVRLGTGPAEKKKLNFRCFKNRLPHGVYGNSKKGGGKDEKAKKNNLVQIGSHLNRTPGTISVLLYPTNILRGFPVFFC